MKSTIKIAMRRIFVIIVCLFSWISLLQAQESVNGRKVRVCCEVTCVRYNLFKPDLNACIDFGLAEKSADAKKWIYNSKNGKMQSFASRMSVARYMIDHGWEYKESIPVDTSSDPSDKDYQWHLIFTKELPADYTESDVIGEINCR